jgi:hypothetical protein
MVIGPYKTAGRIQLGIGVAVYAILFCAWLSLRWLQSGRGRSISIVVSAILNSTFGVLVITHHFFQQHQRVCTIIVLLASIVVAYEVGSSFLSLLTVRSGMTTLWNDQTNVNTWGIGQVGAPFAWAPLLVDMAYEGCGRLQRWRTQSTGVPCGKQFWSLWKPSAVLAVLGFSPSYLGLEPDRNDSSSPLKDAD